jgi:two-component system chemotaxis sensor kinase CheA
MNPLLAQFLAEAADLLTQVDEGLLQLERTPGDPAVVNEVFRAAHTFKGSSGLFDFPELTRLTHAAEDLLAAVRAGELPLDSGMTDDLLAAFDLIRGWLAHVTTAECLPASAAADAAGLITKLRDPIGGEVVREVVVDSGVRGDGAPAWLVYLDEEWLADTAAWLRTTSSTMRFVRYVPDSGCFFRGEDPLHLIGQVPAPARLGVIEPVEWPPAADYDEYACQVAFVLATRAGPGEINYLFRYVIEQIELADLDGDTIQRFLSGELAAETEEPIKIEDPRPSTDPEMLADARAVLTAALRALTMNPTATCHLISIAGAITRAAHVFGDPVEIHEPDVVTLTATATRLLGDTPPADQVVDEAPPARDRRADDPGGQVGSRILRVDQGKVDHLMELVGELNVAKNGLAFLARTAEEEYDRRALSRRIKEHHSGLHRIAEELQTSVMDIRMLPLSVAFNRLPRLVRDLSRRLGKNAEVTVEGEDTMADKDVIEALADPLVHLVRNSLDHGVEPTGERLAAGKPVTARITLAATADADTVVVEISDDGRGVDPGRVRRTAYEKGLISHHELGTLSDPDAVELIFRPGFSTAAEISDLSGRGVGMDAVRAGVEKLGGTVTMRSEPGRGTSTRLCLPLSMVVTQVMVVSVAGQRFGIPVDLVAETVRVPSTELNRVLHQDVVLLRGEVIPVVDLARVLEMPWTPAADQDRAILIAAVGGQRVGLLVERFHREVDVILKPMEGLLAYAGEFCGTALLGDGLVLLVLNLKEVLGLAARVG